MGGILLKNNSGENQTTLPSLYGPKDSKVTENMFCKQK